MPTNQAIVVKVGGSLFDLPNLGPAMRSWLEQLDTRRVLLVSGGGALADAVRVLDQCHRLGEETAHWLALQALAMNARFLAALLANAAVVEQWTDCLSHWEKGVWPVLDAYRFGLQDEGRPGSLPHTWDIASDSVAARAAVIGNARRLILLKSVTIPESMDWRAAGERGLVDRYFAQALRDADLLVESLNFRQMISTV